MISPEQGVVAAILLCMGGAVVTLLASRSKVLASWLAFLFSALSAVFILGAVWKVLNPKAAIPSADFWSMAKIGFAMRLHVDGLTALFLLLAAGIAVPASFYAVSYMRQYTEYGAARFYPYFLLFLGGMYGLLSTTDMMWVFFIFWQLMTLASYALIRFERKKLENVHAANKYLLLMQIACAAVMAGAVLLAPGHSSAAGLKYDFDLVSANLPSVLIGRPAVATLAFALFLVGFGIKAGMWPFGQIWLPDAHPAAPSPVSAMLSGVMIKTGIYGVLRCFMWLVPLTALRDFPLTNWGTVIAVLGTITLFTGTMEGLRQEQSKRLLAFSSIGQIGYVLFAIGASMCLLAAGTPAASSLATLALLGALLHVLNHGIFKSLLFLNAGSMLEATGTQDLNKMGGLMKYMPITGITVLVASFSIAGVPLTNGFVSKWTMFVAAFQGAPYAGFLPLCAAIGILTSAVTLALFIKFFGASFLSRTSALVRSRAAKRETLEVGWMMQAPQVLLASACIVLGVVPAIAIHFVGKVLDTSRQGFGIALANGGPLQSRLSTGVSEVNATALFAPIMVAVVMLLTFGLAVIMSRIGHAQRRTAAAWLCGYAQEAECHRYIASSFYHEIKRHVFGGGVRPARRLS